MRAQDETPGPISLTSRRRESWWNAIRFGSLLTIAGGLVVAAALVLPDWTPRGTGPSWLQIVTTPPVCNNIDCGGGLWLHSLGLLLVDVWLLAGALCLLVGGYNLARRSLVRAGAVFGALAVVLVLGLVGVIAVIPLLLAGGGVSQFLQSSTLLVLAGLGITLTGSVLALRKPKPEAVHSGCVGV